MYHIHHNLTEETVPTSPTAPVLLLASPRLNALAEHALTWLAGHPGSTAAQVSDGTGVADPALVFALLAEKELLARCRVWQTPGTGQPGPGGSANLAWWQWETLPEATA
jgi:hypothetical protein